MDYLAHSEGRRGRPNEDALAVQPHPDDAAMLLCALADGQGGRSGAAAAANGAVAACLTAAAAQAPSRLRSHAAWVAVLQHADRAVAAQPDAGFTTLIGLCVVGDHVYGAACGDSAALLVSPAGATLLTEGQAKNPPIGSGAARPRGFSGTLPGGATLLIMSDGVWKYIGFDAVAELSRGQRAQELIPALRREHLREQGGQLADDFSIVVIGA